MQNVKQAPSALDLLSGRVLRRLHPHILWACAMDPSWITSYDEPHISPPMPTHGNFAWRSRSLDNIIFIFYMHCQLGFLSTLCWTSYSWCLITAMGAENWMQWHFLAKCWCEVYILPHVPISGPSTLNIIQTTQNMYCFLEEIFIYDPWFMVHVRFIEKFSSISYPQA